MLFSSIPFLYYFLPCVLLLYLVAPRKLKNSVLLLSSLFFYGWGEPKYLILMLLSITQGYIFGRLVEKYRGQKRAKLFLTLSVVFSFLMLGYCKYADFFITSFNAVTGLSIPLLKIALPIGISFYTFQIVSYVIDVYRGDVAAQRNYINLAAYISMFPQLIAGPIVRYADIAAQLDSRTHSFAAASKGIRRFIIGLSKKILLANVLGELVDGFKQADDKSVLFYWLYAVAYTLHIYFDFSGYSDMAIGLGHVFGFDFLENFNYPFISRSITEFWRRWHMSLGSWFRDYLYIPLGGNRVSRGRWIFNIAVVWAATGLWHGAAWNFVAWGVYFAVLLVLEKLFLKKWLDRSPVLGHAYVMLLVIFSFVLFDAATLRSAGATIGAMFGAGGIPAASFEALYNLRSYAVVLIFGIIGSTPLPKLAVERIRKISGGDALINAVEPVVLLALLAVSTAFLIDGSFNPFLYFRF